MVAPRVSVELVLRDVLRKAPQVRRDEWCGKAVRQWALGGHGETASPAGAGPVTAQIGLLLAARETKPSEAETEQRERRGFGNGSSSNADSGKHAVN
jgi:hypothetical protein